LYSEKFRDVEQQKKLGELAKVRYEDFRTMKFESYMPKFAKQVIEKYFELGYEIGIISQGTPSLQRRKFDCLNIKDFVNSDLIFFNEKKTIDFYQMVKNTIVEKYGNLELIMIGDREDIDVLIPKSLGFTPIRILGESKYSVTKTLTDYKQFNNFEELFNNLEN